MRESHLIEEGFAKLGQERKLYSTSLLWESHAAGTEPLRTSINLTIGTREQDLLGRMTWCFQTTVSRKRDNATGATAW